MNNVRRRFLSAALVALTALPVMATSAIDAVAVNPPHGSIVSDDPANNTPNVMNGRVNALLVMGNRVFVGGTFTTVQNAGSGQNITRNRLFSFNATTGQIDAGFNPNINNAVEALAPSPNGLNIYVGGRFTSVNGNNGMQRLAQLQISNGAIVAGWDPNPQHHVYDLVTRGTTLYAAGRFTSIGGAPRAGLAALNTANGSALNSLNIPFTGAPIDGIPLVWKIDVTGNGSTMVVTGNFDQAGGQPRMQMAMVNLATNPASLTSWRTDVFPFFGADGRTYCAGVFPHYIRDLDISPDGSYAVVITTGGNNPNRLCDTITRWELGRTGPGQQPTWITSTGGDSLHSVITTGAAIYGGGHQQWVNNPYNPTRCGRCDGPFPGGVPRQGFSAHDPLNGLPYSWNPGRNPRGKGVLAMVGTPNGFYFGSDTDRVAGELRRKLAFMPLAGGTAIPNGAMPTLPGGFYSVSPAGAPTTMVRRTYNGTTFGAPTAVGAGVNWNDVRGAFALNGNLYTGRADGTFTVRSFNGTTAGAATTINLFGLQTAPDPVVFQMPVVGGPIPSLSSHLSTMTGLTFDQGWLYYTVQGDPRLYSRGFTPESRVVGAPILVASTGDGVNWANVRGMALVSGNLYFALANGTLNRVAWSNGHPTGAVTTIGGPGIDGTDWAAGGLFVF